MNKLVTVLFFLGALGAATLAGVAAWSLARAGGASKDAAAMIDFLVALVTSYALTTLVIYVRMLR